MKANFEQLNITCDDVKASKYFFLKAHLASHFSRLFNDSSEAFREGKRRKKGKMLEIFFSLSLPPHRS